MGIASDVSLVFSTLTIIAEIFAVIILLALFFKNSWGKSIVSFAGRNALLGAFVVSLLAMVGSLMYSEVVGFEPCKLCWWQRIFMYPQVFILGLALWKKDLQAIYYSLLLSVIGALIAIYHYLIQTGFFQSAPCSATGVSCDKVYNFSYGYITIPMMALSAFVLIIMFAIAKAVYSRV